MRLQQVTDDLWVNPDHIEFLEPIEPYPRDTAPRTLIGFSSGKTQIVVIPVAEVAKLLDSSQARQ